MPAMCEKDLMDVNNLKVGWVCGLVVKYTPQIMVVAFEIRQYMY